MARSAIISRSLDTWIEVSKFRTLSLTRMVSRESGGMVKVGWATGPADVIYLTSTFAACFEGFCNSNQVSNPRALEPSARYQVLLPPVTPIESWPPLRWFQY